MKIKNDSFILCLINLTFLNFIAVLSSREGVPLDTPKIGHKKCY